MRGNTGQWLDTMQSMHSVCFRALQNIRCLPCQSSVVTIAVHLIQCMGPPLLVKPFMVGTHLVSGKLPCASPTRLQVLLSWTRRAEHSVP